MTIQFQLTYDDFREGAIGQAQASAKRRSGGRARLVGFGVFVGVWVIGSMLIPLFRQSPGNPNSTLADYVNLFMPMLALWVIYLPIVALSHGFRSKQARMNLGFLLFFVLGVALFVFLTLFARSIASTSVPGFPVAPTAEPDWLAIFYPHFSWLVLLLFFAIFTIRVRRGQLRKLWDNQQQLHQPQTVEITVNGITITSPLSRHEYRWEAIPKLFETANLFLLFVSNLNFYMFPKRAFAGDEEREAFRNMAKNLAAKENRGFEVIAGVPVAGSTPPN